MVNSLSLMTAGGFCHKRQDTEIAQKWKIHWKALEKHFLMVPLVFRINHFRGKLCSFGIFLKQTSVLIN
jgi:hypothetical protein